MSDWFKQVKSVSCDRCHAKYPWNGDRPGIARASAIDEGWTVVGPDTPGAPIRDFCPPCVGVMGLGEVIAGAAKVTLDELSARPHPAPKGGRA